MSSSQTTGGKKRISYSSQYVPDMLKEQQIWCCFKVKPRPDGRMTKIPCTPTSEAIVGEIGSSAHRSQLVGYEEAVAAYQKNPHTFGGIGFFTDKQLGIVLADFDNCYDEDGSLHPYVEMALTMLDSYTEESLSGTGKHCLFVGELPGDKKVFKDDGIELYDTHFVVWTENRDDHYPVTIESRQRELDVVYKDLQNRQALRKKGQPKQVAEENAIPCVLPLSLSDGELIEKARAAKGRAGADFVRLHDRGDIAGFTHPDGTVDPSRADFRLFSLLAFWSGRDPVQMERIAKTSAIYRPERWEKGNYLDRTIAAAIAKCPTVYTGAGKRGTGGESTEFEGMFWRIMSHTELSINRRLALLAIAVEYKSNLHKMDEKGFVPICYRFMSKWCHINEQALCDAGSVAASYKLLEKKHNPKGGEDFKINLRVKMSEDVAQCRFPTLEQTKKPGGKRVKCPSCATEEVEIWSKSTTSIICCNPDCDHYGEVREIHTHTKKKQQRAKTPQEEPLQQYHCTLPTAIEETRPVSQLDVQRNYGESGIIPPCDTHVSQLDVTANALSHEECGPTLEEIDMTSDMPVSQLDGQEGAYDTEIGRMQSVSQIDVSYEPPVQEEYETNFLRETYISQLDVQRNYGKSEIIPPCDTHISQFDVREKDEEKPDEVPPEPLWVSQNYFQRGKQVKVPIVTFQQKMIQKLCDNGKLREDAEAIVMLAMEDPSLAGIRTLWKYGIKSYSPQMQDAFWQLVSQRAAK